MFWKKCISIIASVFLIVISACSMPRGPVVDNGTGQDSTAAIETRIAEIVASTAAAQTALANSMASTLAAMATNTSESTSTPSLTLTPSFTLTPSITPTSSFTPTLTFTLTPEVPMVSVSVQTNCRSGPGTAYDILGIMNVGETAQVVGRSASSDNWIIKLPSNPGITCWLWGQYATVVGNTAGLPVIAPPPTPTPVTAFIFSYHFWGVGPGYQCLLFDVTNTGGSTWESYTLSLQDITHGDTGTSSHNEFIGYDNWCNPTVTLLDLTPGEAGTASALMYMVHDPSGDHFEATLTLCSGNDQTGNCLTKSISFIF